MKYSCKWFVNGIDVLNIHSIVLLLPLLLLLTYLPYTNWRIQWSEQDSQTIVLRKCYYHKFFHDKNQFLLAHSLSASSSSSLSLSLSRSHVCTRTENHVTIKCCACVFGFSVLNKFSNQIKENRKLQPGCRGIFTH